MRFVSGSWSGSCPVRVRCVFGLVSGFAFGSRPGSCPGGVWFMSVSCLGRVRVRVGVCVWVRVWFLPGLCLIRVWFVSGVCFGSGSGRGSYFWFVFSGI